MSASPPSPSGARAAILARIRAALAARPDKRPLPDYPDEATFTRQPDGDLSAVARFRARLEAAHGRLFDDARALGAWLIAQGATRGYCDPALAPALAPAFGAAVTLETAFDRARADDFQFGITRAAGGIAETGTVILDDAGTSSRLGALAPWIHVAVLDPARLHARVAGALRAAAPGAPPDPYVLWCTGPSKTADVEGILIEGVHGPGEQVVLLAAL